MLRYAVNEKKLDVVYPAAKEIFQPLNESGKGRSKKKVLR